MRKKPPKEEPECCFTCKSFSSRHGRKGFGYCMKFCDNRKPKDICGEYMAVFKPRWKYV